MVFFGHCRLVRTSTLLSIVLEKFICIDTPLRFYFVGFEVRGVGDSGAMNVFLTEVITICQKSELFFLCATLSMIRVE